MVRVTEGKNYIENDLKGDENCFELAGSLSYREFEIIITNKICYRGLASRPCRLSPWVWYQLFLASQYPCTVCPARGIIGIQLRYLPIILSKVVT